MSPGLPSARFQHAGFCCIVCTLLFGASRGPRKINSERWINGRVSSVANDTPAAILGLQSQAGEIANLAFLCFEDNDKRSFYDRLRYLFSSEPFSITDMVIRKALEAETLRALAVAAIGIERHRIRFGAVPESLDVLVPRYLPSVPRDVMDGGVLKYQCRSATEFVLYSVGSDGRDDGGDGGLASNKTSYRSLLDGRDSVWPLAAE
jgi:hypothetical protein